MVTNRHTFNPVQARTPFRQFFPPRTRTKNERTPSMGSMVPSPTFIHATTGSLGDAHSTIVATISNPAIVLMVSMDARRPPSMYLQNTPQAEFQVIRFTLPAPPFLVLVVLLFIPPCVLQITRHGPTS